MVYMILLNGNGQGFYPLKSGFGSVNLLIGFKRHKHQIRNLGSNSTYTHNKKINNKHLFSILTLLQRAIIMNLNAISSNPYHIKYMMVQLVVMGWIFKNT